MKGPWRKLSLSLLDSSTLRDPLLRGLAVDLLLLCDRRGFIRMDYPEIADRLGRTVDELLELLRQLEEPRAQSRDQTAGGAFLIRLSKNPNCWRIVNFLKYQDEAKVEKYNFRKAKNMRAYRARLKEKKVTAPLPRDRKVTGALPGVTDRDRALPEALPPLPMKSVTGVTGVLPPVTETLPRNKKEIEIESTHRQDGCVRKNELITSEWIAQLAQDPIYSGLNVRRELAKMSNEYKVQRRILTRGGFVKWLNNRADDSLLPDQDDGERLESEEVMRAIGRALGQ